MKSFLGFLSFIHSFVPVSFFFHSLALFLFLLHSHVFMNTFLLLSLQVSFNLFIYLINILILIYSIYFFFHFFSLHRMICLSKFTSFPLPFFQTFFVYSSFYSFPRQFVHYFLHSFLLSSFFFIHPQPSINSSNKTQLFSFNPNFLSILI